MPRFKLTVEYDGRGLVGWQRQNNGPSAQEALETAIHRFCQEAAAVHGAGRTDAGVHALGQVAHVDLACTPTPHTVRNAINFHLKPAAIAVLTAEAVDQAFHARFSARSRAYRYRILNRPAPPVLDRGRVWWVPRELDADAMKEAAAVLAGRHDFNSFRATICQAKSPVRTLDRLTVWRRADDVVIEAEARSFLHHQVRNMVGALKWVGEGRWTAADLAAALAARDRRRGGPTAPAEGLYLVHVTY